MQYKATDAQPDAQPDIQPDAQSDAKRYGRKAWRCRAWCKVTGRALIEKLCAMQTDAELDAESWYQTTSWTTKLSQSLCYFDQLPYRHRHRRRYSVRLPCPYCLDQLLYLYYSRSVPLLDLFTARSAGSIMPFNCSDRPVLGLMLFWLFYCCSPDRHTLPYRPPFWLAATNRPLPTECYWPFCRCCYYCCCYSDYSNCCSYRPFRSTVPIVLPLLFQPTATDRLPLPRSLLPKFLLPNVLLLTNCYRVLLPSVLPLTVLFYCAGYLL